jgi:predicted metal-dependent peptidase
MDLHRIKARGVGGKGGTSVDPVMRWIADSTEKPDMLICFTDGCVTFPKKEPAFPVIWADVGGTTYPWGEVVRIKP